MEKILDLKNNNPPRTSRESKSGFIFRNKKIGFLAEWIFCSIEKKNNKFVTLATMVSINSQTFEGNFTYDSFKFACIYTLIEMQQVV